MHCTGCGEWSLKGKNNESWYWRPEYDYPLGDPVGPPSYVSGVWKRSFASETEVMLDASNNKGTIHWSIMFLPAISYVAAKVSKIWIINFLHIGILDVRVYALSILLFCLQFLLYAFHLLTCSL